MSGKLRPGATLATEDWFICSGGYHVTCVIVDPITTRTRT